MSHSNPPAGTIVKRRMHAGGPLAPLMWLLYRHFGIYVGDGRIVHFAGEGDKAGDVRVRDVPVDEFLEGERLRVHRRPNNARHAQAIVAEAQRWVGRACHGPYHLVLNNCEDFAKHCYEIEYEA